MTTTDTSPLAATVAELRRAYTITLSCTCGRPWSEHEIGEHWPNIKYICNEVSKQRDSPDAEWQPMPVRISTYGDHRVIALLDAVDALELERDRALAERDRLRHEIALIRADAERIRSWGTGLHADQDGSLSCILYHCDAALAPSGPVAERDDDGN